MSLKTFLPENFSRFAKRVYLGGRKIYFHGNTFHCPVCSGNFRKMLPAGFDNSVNKEKEIIGAGLRDNNICPACQSTDRDRLIYVYLTDTGFLAKEQKMLHVSPEPALYNAIKKNHKIHYTTGTKYSEGIYYPKNIMSIDLLDLVFDDNTFDFVMCNHVLEHIEDDHKAMTELYRVLKHGGSGILQVPVSRILKYTYENPDVISENDRTEIFGQFDHVRIYGNDYSDRLNKAGFEVTEYQAKSDDVSRFAINPDEKLFVVHKK